MKGSAVFLALGAVALLAWPVHKAVADETSDTTVKIQAPLDAVDCTAATITVLGLSIDVSNASIDAQDSGSGQTVGSCADLNVGDSVEVVLASDTVPLTATSVDDQGAGESEVSIQAPLQPIDANGDATDGQSIQLIGLTIDISQLQQQNMEGDDDSGTPTAPVGLSNLMVGQFVEVTLASNTSPLVATQLDVKNFTNTVDVEVDDQTGTEVEDTDQNGNPQDDVTVEVDDTVVVQAPTPPGATTRRHRRMRKVVQFQVASSGGTISLAGLPTGHAKIYVTRVHNGVATVGHRGVHIRGNTSRSVRVRLRQPRTH